MASGAVARSRRPLVVAGVAIAVAATVVVRFVLAGTVATPWILIDELLYASLAESIATDGRLAVRGEPLTTSVLYPLLLAPAWLVGDVGTAYGLAKAINVVTMSAAAVPVFLWARRLAGAGPALVAAGLTLLLPGLVYTTALMTENLFLPLFVLAGYALARALEEPGPGRWLLALGAAALAVGARPQGLVLGAVLPVALLVFAGLEARTGGGSFGRELRRSGAWAAAPALALALVWAGASLPLLELEPYRGALASSYDPGAVLRWAAHNAGALALTSGLLPAMALPLLGLTTATRAERALVATAAAAAAGLVLLAAATSTLDPPGIRERYAFHAAPLLLIALVVWLRRGAPRAPAAVAVAAAAGVAALVATLPLRRIFGSGSFLGDGFSLIPFWRLARVLPGEVAAAHVVVAAGAAGAALLFLLTPRRLARALLPALVALHLAASSAAVSATARSQALGVAIQSGQRDGPAWIDEAVGADADVAYLNVVPAPPADWIAVWHAEFWNRSLARVVSVGPTEPSPLPQESAPPARDGRVPPVASFLVLPTSVDVEGEEVAEAGPLRLFRVGPSLRVLGIG